MATPTPSPFKLTPISSPERITELRAQLDAAAKIKNEQVAGLIARCNAISVVKPIDIAHAYLKESPGGKSVLNICERISQMIDDGKIIPDAVFEGRTTQFAFKKCRVSSIIATLQGKTPAPQPITPTPAPAAIAAVIGTEIMKLTTHPAAAVRNPIQNGIEKSLAAVAKIDRAAFDQLSHAEKSAFCVNGGRIAEPVAPPVPPIAPNATSITRAQFDTLTPQAKADWFKAGKKLTN